MSTTSLSFSTSSILNQAWALLKQHWAFLLGVWLVVFIISALTGAFQGVVQESDSSLLALTSLAVQVVSMWISVGLMRLMIKLVRGEKVEMSELWTGWPYLWQYFIGALVVGLVVMLGLVLLIIPGVIWALTYMFTQYILVDEKIGFSEAMAQSKAMTQGIKWQLIGFGLAMVGINLLGCLALLLGLLVTVPLTTLASFVLYVELRKQYLAQTSGQTELPNPEPAQTAN